MLYLCLGNKQVSIFRNTIKSLYSYQDKNGLSPCSSTNYSWLPPSPVTVCKNIIILLTNIYFNPLKLVRAKLYFRICFTNYSTLIIFPSLYKNSCDSQNAIFFCPFGPFLRPSPFPSLPLHRSGNREDKKRIGSKRWDIDEDWYVPILIWNSLPWCILILAPFSSWMLLGPLKRRKGRIIFRSAHS